jgi:hypothetical protein
MSKEHMDTLAVGPSFVPVWDFLAILPQDTVTITLITGNVKQVIR